ERRGDAAAAGDMLAGVVGRFTEGGGTSDVREARAMLERMRNGTGREADMERVDLFAPFAINGVAFRNRILRSSVGGRTCNYDGTVTDVWKNFERKFAAGGIGGIISTTFHTNKDRLSPLQYPSIADDKYLPWLQSYIASIQATQDCKYIVQIGDPGYTTY